MVTSTADDVINHYMGRGQVVVVTDVWAGLRAETQTFTLEMGVVTL